MTVVEMDEWIPTEQFSLKKDNITDAYFGVIYAKFPSSALGHHGILIRLLSSDEQTKGPSMSFYLVFSRFCPDLIQI